MYLTRFISLQAAVYELAALEGLPALPSASDTTDGADNIAKMMMLMWSEAHDGDDVFGIMVD